MTDFVMVKVWFWLDKNKTSSVSRAFFSVLALEIEVENKEKGLKCMCHTLFPTPRVMLTETFQLFILYYNAEPNEFFHGFSFYFHYEYDIITANNTCLQTKLPRVNKVQTSTDLLRLGFCFLCMLSSMSNCCCFCCCCFVVVFCFGGC